MRIGSVFAGLQPTVISKVLAIFVPNRYQKSAKIKKVYFTNR